MAAIAFRNRVLNLWFSNNRWSSENYPPAKSAPIDASDMSRWFRSSKEFDTQIRENFEDDLERLVNNEYRYPGDLDHPEHLLACNQAIFEPFLIALDQFPRNIYRSDARAFSYDYKAKELSELLISHQGDKQLPYVERVFAYLPFQHSENLDDQNRSVIYCQELCKDAKNDSTTNEGVLTFLNQALHSSEEHREIIQQFGRYPHRNAVLNRQTLENEDLYLRNGGAKFGQ